MVPGPPSLGVETGDENKTAGLINRVLALRPEYKCSVLERKFWKESRLVTSSHKQRCRSFSEQVGSRIMFTSFSLVLLESLPK